MKRLNSKIRRIGRQKSGRGQNRVQGRGGKTGRKQGNRSTVSRKPTGSEGRKKGG